MPVTGFLSVATAGKTIDGREITPEQIDQMAEAYSPKTYAARVWVEHQRFWAFGDVLEVKADTVNGKRTLFAKINGTPDLVSLNSADQKKYFSIEFLPKFADTGKAYLCGLAVTDSPASLGTDALKFSVQGEAKMFSASIEGMLEFEGQPKDTGPGLMSKVMDLLSGKGKTDDARVAQVEQAVTAVAESVAELKDSSNFAKTSEVKTLSDQIAAIRTSLDDLISRMSQTPSTPQRQPATGGDATMTDC